MDENLPTPTIEGQGGKAWLMDEQALKDNVAKPNSEVVMWIIEARWANPMWHSYGLSLVHLRPVKGLGEPLIYLAGATHEVILGALDPRVPRSVDMPVLWLQPLNFAAQIIALSDIAAAQRIHQCAQDIVDGKLSPDSDYRHLWIERFNGLMLKGALENN